MVKSTFEHVEVKGISVVVPEKEINIYDEAQYYDNSIKKVDRMRKMVGFHKRRVADATTTAADLAINAAENLLKDMNIDRSSIDALVFVVQKPDYMNPSTAYFIHQKLGLSDDCIATDVNQGCVGWVFGLFMVSQMIESRAFKRVLLLNGDTPSIGIDLANRISAPLFGDGGVATLVEYVEQKNTSYFNLETKSQGFEALITPFSGIRNGFDKKNPNDINLLMQLLNEKIETAQGNVVNIFDPYMDGMAVFNFTIDVVPNNIKELLKYADLTQNDVDMLCLHQANKQIVQAVGAGAGFGEEKVPYVAFENYGNNTMCSIPSAIASLPKNLQKNKLCCSGFGNGLVCASCIIDLSKTYVLEVKNFVKPSYVQTRDECIDYWKAKIRGEN